MSVLDKRRTDARVPVNGEPFFFTSAIVDKSDAGNTTILKDFLKDDGTYLILHAGFEVIEAFDGSASIIVGRGTLATKAAGTITAVDADEELISTDITEATIGYYQGGGAAAATALGIGAPIVVKGADATVPIVYVTLTSTNQTVGKGRVHLMLVKVPTAN